MSLEVSQKVTIQKVKNSKINQVDFNNLPFGQVCTDHMLVCDFENGKWSSPKIIPYQAISLDPSAKIFHYGQSVFEGMKAYKDAHDDIWLFRPLDNQKRLNISSKRLAMPELPESYFMEGLEALLLLEANNQQDIFQLLHHQYTHANQDNNSVITPYNQAYRLLLSF